MGLFSKKTCDICGQDIGLLGNRKLADGNLCKHCAARLSPFLTDRRQLTVEEIAAHLRYREENERALGALRPTRLFGRRTTLYLDEEKGVFWLSSRTDWLSDNPDIIPLDQVVSARLNLHEHRSELYQKDAEGKNVRYDPPRYEVDYTFTIEIVLDSPWFSVISFELSDERPDSPYTDLYRDLEREADEMIRALTSPALRQSAPVAPTAPQVAEGSWFCPECGAQNAGNFCSACGTKRPALPRACRSCGYTPEDPANPPKFCPNCGTKFE